MGGLGAAGVGRPGVAELQGLGWACSLGAARPSASAGRAHLQKRLIMLLLPTPPLPTTSTLSSRWRLGGWRRSAAGVFSRQRRRGQPVVKLRQQAMLPAMSPETHQDTPSYDPRPSPTHLKVFHGCAWRSWRPRCGAGLASACGDSRWQPCLRGSGSDTCQDGEELCFVLKWIFHPRLATRSARRGQQAWHGLSSRAGAKRPSGLAARCAC